MSLFSNSFVKTHFPKQKRKAIITDWLHKVCTEKFQKAFKVQMKWFFLLPNLKEEQKSGRSPFTVLNISSSSRVIMV